MNIGEKVSEYYLIDENGFFCVYDYDADGGPLKFGTLEEAVEERVHYAGYMDVPESTVGILLIEETVIA